MKTEETVSKGHVRYHQVTQHTHCESSRKRAEKKGQREYLKRWWLITFKISWKTGNEISTKLNNFQVRWNQIFHIHIIIKLLIHKNKAVIFKTARDEELITYKESSIILLPDAYGTLWKLEGSGPKYSKCFNKQKNSCQSRILYSAFPTLPIILLFMVSVTCSPLQSEIFK